MWFTTALSTNFGQTGVAPVEEFLIISGLYINIPHPKSHGFGWRFTVAIWHERDCGRHHYQDTMKLMRVISFAYH